MWRIQTYMSRKVLGFLGVSTDPNSIHINSIGCIKTLDALSICFSITNTRISFLKAVVIVLWKVINPNDKGICELNSLGKCNDLYKTHNKKLVNMFHFYRKVFFVNNFKIIWTKLLQCFMGHTWILIYLVLSRKHSWTNKLDQNYPDHCYCDMQQKIKYDPINNVNT